MVIIQLIDIKSFAQNKPISNHPSISETDIIGIWQLNSPSIGANLLECFRFYSDGKFIYEYDGSDDTRNIIKLKGTYRLDNNRYDRLFFTITSRIERIGGKIISGAVGTDEFLFVFDNDSTKETIEKIPNELDPLFISKINKKSNQIDLYINNRKYYKVSSDPNKFKDQ